jgi:hypothetical protein
VPSRQPAGAAPKRWHHGHAAKKCGKSIQTSAVGTDECGRRAVHGA